MPKRERYGFVKTVDVRVHKKQDLNTQVSYRSFLLFLMVHFKTCFRCYAAWRQSRNVEQSPRTVKKGN